MKSVFKNSLTLCSLAVLTFTSQSTFAASASATGNGSATVITPIAISETTALGFGDFAAGTGGTVVIATDGSRTATGDVSLSSTDAGAQAVFAVTGEAGYTYAITLPAGSATLDDGSGNTMSVGTWTSDPSGTGTLTGGAENVNVGATITVGSGQTPGTYTGTYTVTVDYN